MESGGRKGTQRMRLGRDGVWWEKGNTENEVVEGWSLVGERDTMRLRSEENWEKTHGMYM